MARNKRYEGENIAVTFDLQVCVHSRKCWLALPQVFDPSRRPWVLPDNGSADEIAAMVRTCPSGALQFERKDGGLDEVPSGTNIAQISENGPIKLKGDFRFGDQTITRATLCRCGLSKNKPFCDNSHLKGHFRATGECDVTDRDSAEGLDGTVEITENPNGSLKFDGNLEVINGNGRRIARTNAVRLCRCGQSNKKPFCDGSHKAAGFTTED
ncbi:MAG: CDGSH iron-sulfur domain-containing protein [Paracoccaceae bacterium]|nr:CDGSH iron-sulfur domain-containing protein [Paracoccaceae bacterium]MDG2258913.1 CDGSH iron-sulfur domain-containing protein [Paracoccaceae bacterium]